MYNEEIVKSFELRIREMMNRAYEIGHREGWDIRGKWTVKDKKTIVQEFQDLLGPEYAYNQELFKIRNDFVAFHKIHGPILLSINLNFSNGLKENYRVDFNVVNLASRFILYKSLICRPRFAELDRTELKAGVNKLIVDMIKAGPYTIESNAGIPMFKALSLEDIFQGYRYNFQWIQRYPIMHGEHNARPIINRIHVRPGRELLLGKTCPGPGGASVIHQYGEPAIYAAWCGDEKKAQEYYEWGYDILISEYQENSDYVKQWALEHQLAINNPELLRINVRQNIKKLEIEFAPYWDIEGAAYKEMGITNKK